MMLMEAPHSTPVRDFVFISSIEWDRLWQGHHELAWRLAQGGRRVLFVENTGVRAPGLRDAGRVVARLGAFAVEAGRGGPREVAPRLWLSSPLALPPLGRGPARWVNRRLLVPRVAADARAADLRSPVVWSYLPTDTALDLAEALRGPDGLLVFACLADFRALIDRPGRLVRHEEEMLRRADLVYALPGLVERCARVARGPVLPMPPPVNLELFAEAKRPPRRDGRPVVGYVGGLHRHVDLSLLAGLARERPDWRFVLVGPAQEPVPELRAASNVELVGAVPHDQLPEIVAGFDVGLVPYALTEYNRSTAPTKLGEYLAAGCPVVSTPIPYAVDLHRRHGLIALAEPHPEAFARAIAAALAGDDPDLRARRRGVAEALSWQSAVVEVLDAIAALDGRDAPALA
jgi:glycosyltransferase involved in cell wall biosynthesis